MEKAQQTWINSIELNTDVSIQNALRVIYENYVKIELVRATGSLEINNYSSLPIEDLNTILEIEYARIQNKINLSDFIYSLHDEDTYKDIFCDNITKLRDKRDGVKFAIKKLNGDYL